MTDREGFVKFHRSLLDWEWYSDLPVRVLFMHLLLSCRYTPGRWQGEDLKPGQLPTSLPRLAAETSLSEQQIRTALRKLQSTGEITDRSTNAYRLITIEKWGQYAGRATDRTTGHQQASNRQATDDQQAINSTIRRKEGKKERRKEGEPIGSVTEPVTDLSVEKNLQSEPQHEGARADHRDPAITELVEYASAKLRENGLPGGLDSDWIATKGGKRLDGNRAAARNILAKLAKDYPNHPAPESAKHLVDVALRDPFHKTNFTRLSYLYRHMTAIIQNHKNPRNHGQQSASDKFAGALEILQSGALSGGLFAGSSPYSEP